MLAAIKTAKYYDLGPSDVIVTVATDGAAMYGTERDVVRRGQQGSHAVQAEHVGYLVRIDDHGGRSHNRGNDH